MISRFVRLLVSTVFTLSAFMLAACGGSSVAVPRTQQANAPQANAPSTASIVINIPPRTTSSSLRHVSFVSSLAESASLTIAPVSGCSQCSPTVSQSLALVGAGSPCTTSAPITCTIALTLLPGSYTGTLSLYDGILNGGVPSGNILSTASFPAAIVSGSPNVIPVTLFGIPKGFAITSATPTTLYVQSNARINGAVTTALRIIGGSSVGTLTVTAKDIDGSFIVGPGAPTWTVSGTATSFPATVNGNTISFTAPANHLANGGTVTFTANSPACADPSAVCTFGGFAVEFAQLIATSNGIGVASVQYIGSPTTFATITNGIVSPSAAAFTSNGSLFVLNGNNTVTLYAPPYNAAPAATISIGGSTLLGIAVNNSDELIVATNTGAKIFAPPYLGAPTTVATVGAPVAVAVDPALNALWIVESPGTLERFPHPYASHDVAITNPQATLLGPTAIAIDVDGRPWIANTAANDALMFAPPFSTSSPSLTESNTISQPLSLPLVIASVNQGNGALLVGGAHTINTYPVNGAPTLASIDLSSYSSSAKALALATDQDAIVWAPLSGTGQIVGFPPPYDGTNAQAIPAPGGFASPVLAIY